jgi:hypothetical protein
MELGTRKRTMEDERFEKLHDGSQVLHPITT